jgi:dethiobiotin synthetase
MRGLFVTATDTNVGKTWVGRHLIQALKEKGIEVVPRKPVESGWNDDLKQNDAWILANAADKTKDLESICPNRFKAAISPDRAASIEGKTLSIDQLHQQCLKDVDDKDFLYVEGAGGFYSPLCSDGLNADLAIALGLPVLLVVENRLGCINQALLSVEAIESRGLKLIALVLNNPMEAVFDSNMDNLTDLRNRSHYPVIAFNHITDYENDTYKAIREQLCSLVVKEQ